MKKKQPAKAAAGPAPGQRTNKELESLLLSLAELLQNANGNEDRRNFIMRLQGQAVPGSEIEKITTAAFGINKKQFEGDLLWIQDYWESFTDSGSSKARKQEVLAYNAELLRRALVAEDLATAQRANQHRARLLKIS